MKYIYFYLNIIQNIISEQKYSNQYFFMSGFEINSLLHPDEKWNIKQTETSKKRRFKELQSIKQIARSIKLLLESHRSLEIKDIMYVLCQMTTESEEGLMLSSGSLTSKQTSSLLSKLRLKLDSEDRLDESDTNAAKNIRRRLYDVLNVLISAGIISKFKRSVSIIQPGESKDKKIQKNNMKLQQMKNLLKSTINHKRRDLKQKQQELSSISQKYLIMQKLIQSNRENAVDTQPFERLNLPLTYIPAFPGYQIELSEEEVKIAGDNMKMYGDMQMLKRAFPIKNLEITKKTGNNQNNQNIEDIE